jgi:hypothetical protein
MDAWATAINLRGLFTAEAPANTPPPAPPAVLAPPEPAAAPPRVKAAPVGGGVSLRPILRTTQIVLWSMCVLVVLAGVVLFTRAFLVARSPQEEAAAAAVFATFFIAAYVLARSGEKLARQLLARARRQR